MSELQHLYGAHFGLSGRPFSPLADGREMHMGPDHLRAAAAVEFALVSGAPFAVLTGAPGSGKTSILLRMMEEVLADARVALIDHIAPGGSTLEAILTAFEQPVPEGRGACLTAVQDLLIAAYAEGSRTVLLIDESQELDVAALGELRLLSNINTARDQVLQVVLSGQPPLLDRLSAPELAGLAQRVGSWARIGPLDPTAMGDYVAHRMHQAGGPADLFAADALEAVHLATGGLPRPVNQLCELGLIFAMSAGSDRVGAADIARAIEDGLFRPVPAAPAPRPSGNGAAVAHLRLASGA